jgi:hypothetical protein
MAWKREIILPTNTDSIGQLYHCADAPTTVM